MKTQNINGERKKLTSNSEIVGEIRDIFTMEEPDCFSETPNEESEFLRVIKAEEFTSLYEIAILLNKESKRRLDIEMYYEKEIEMALAKKDDRFDSSLVNIVGFNKEELEIDFAYSRYSSYDPIYFKKNGDDLYVSRHKSCWYEEVLAGAYLVISKVYDELLKMQKIKDTTYTKIKPLNSNFNIKISEYGVSVKDIDNYTSKFELSTSTVSGKTKCNCNSSIVLSAVDGKEWDILKKIYVKIEDCPEWMKQELYDRRKQQLERRLDPLNLNTKSSLIRKLFPFIK